MNKKNLYIGWDIGGAHTKYTIIKENSLILSSKITFETMEKFISTKNSDR